MTRIWYWRASLCERLISLALKIAPPDYTPSVVEAVIRTASSNGDARKVLDKAFPPNPSLPS